MDKRRFALLAVLMIGGLAAPAAASAATVPIAVTPSSPVNGGVYPASTTDAYVIPFAAQWTPPTSWDLRYLFVEITNQYITGQDGTLADDPQHRVGSGSLEPGDADPTAWRGDGSGSFLSTPGTYFFQFHAFGANDDCGDQGGSCTLASPIFTMTIQAAPQPKPAPQPAPAPVPASQAFMWSGAAAKSSVSRVIKAGTRRSAKNLHRSCARVSNVRFKCRADWRDTKWIWAGRLTLTLDSTSNEISYSFKGRRASRTCVRTKSLKRCQRTASFSA